MIHIMPAIISMNNCINAMNTAHLLSEIEDNEEWGYCPFFVFDQVEATNCNLDKDWEE